MSHAIPGPPTPVLGRIWAIRACLTSSFTSFGPPCQPPCQPPSRPYSRPPRRSPCRPPCYLIHSHIKRWCVLDGVKNVTNGATNGQGDSRSRIHGDSFAWSRWNSMCSPKTLSGIVFLPHQSQLKYVETVSLQCVDVEFNVLSQNVVIIHAIYHTHHS